jgi:hypothetical protein
MILVISSPDISSMSSFPNKFLQCYHNLNLHLIVAHYQAKSTSKDNVKDAL